MPLRKHQTTVTLPVELTFDILPPLEVEERVFPAMLDITKVMVTIVGPNSKPRTIDITNTFSEEEIMMLEDDIMENYEE